MFFNLETYNHTNHLHEFIGGKAANLVRMMELGLPVPSGYVCEISTHIQYATFKRKGSSMKILIKDLEYSLARVIANLEQKTGKKFGAKTKTNVPLLLSVRSGAPVSMPGMMDTILNVGLNDKSVKSLAAHTNPEFAWDSYRRLIQAYGTTVLGIESQKFEKFVQAARHFSPSGVLSVPLSQHLVDQFKIICEGQFPQDEMEQLQKCVIAVWDSWNSERAIAYRAKENISDKTGTAVLLQLMVFGNLNKNSGTGVLFTRNPTTGDNGFYGDFLLNAQGEDVVSGTTSTQRITDLPSIMPEVYDELEQYASKLERSLQDMCDIEFTVEDGTLYLLQVRVGKRSPKASNRINLNLLKEGIIDVATAEERLCLVETATSEVDVDGFVFAGYGQVAHDGDVQGVLALNKEDAITLHEEGKTPILFTVATDPADMPGIAVSAGIVTLTGGLVSHAAVVARAWNLPCIVSLDGVECYNSVVNVHKGNEVLEFHTGDLISIKASEKGAVYLKKAE